MYGRGGRRSMALRGAVPGRYLSGVALIALLGAGCGAASSPTSSSTPGSSANVNFPTKPITMYVGFAAGSAVDLEAREFAKELSAVAGWNVAVVDKPGASELLSEDATLGPPADGYSLLFSTVTVAYNAAAPNPQITDSDFAPIAEVAYQPPALAVSASSPYHTMAQFAAAAKASPGKLTVAGPAANDIETAMFQLIAQAYGIQATWVPYTGGSQVTAAILSGATNAGMAGASNFLSGVQAGKLRYLGMPGPAAAFASVGGTQLNSGGKPLDYVVWYGVLAKAGTPAAIVNRIAAGAKKVTETSGWAAYQAQEYLTTQYRDPAQFTSYINSQTALLTPVAKKLAASSS